MVGDQPLMQTSKCSAYVNFGTHSEAVQAQRELDGRVVVPGMAGIRVEFYASGRKLRAISKDRSSQFRTLFIRGMSLEVS